MNGPDKPRIKVKVGKYIHFFSHCCDNEGPKSPFLKEGKIYLGSQFEHPVLQGGKHGGSGSWSQGTHSQEGGWMLTLSWLFCIFKHVGEDCGYTHPCMHMWWWSTFTLYAHVVARGWSGCILYYSLPYSLSWGLSLTM